MKHSEIRERWEVIAKEAIAKGILVSAAKFGVSRQTVRNACFALGIELPSHLDERRKQRKLIADFVRGGKTVAEAATEFGVGDKTVYAVCRSANVTAKSRTRIAPLSLSTFAIIADLIRADETLTAIAVRLGVHVTGIHAIYVKCRAAGIPVRLRTRGRKQSGSLDSTRKVG